MCYGPVLALTLTLVAWVAGSVDRTGNEVWRVQTSNIERVDQVLKLAENYNLDEWVEVNQPAQHVDVMVHPDTKHLVKKSLLALALPYVPIIPDVEETTRKHMAKQKPDGKYDYLTFNTFEDNEKELKRIAAAHPTLTKLQVMGKTHEGRNIYMLRVSKNITPEPTKPIMIIDAGIHSREWITVSTIMNVINKLVENPTGDRMVDGFLNSYDFALWPMLNPDGYAYSWEHDRLWRKNRAPNANSTCVGTDPNRNWGYKWGGVGTSGNPCSTTYHGPAPFSELETQAVRDWVEKYKDEIVLYINLHAYSQMWMTPYGYGLDLADNQEDLMKYAKIASDTIKGVRGTNFEYGPVYSTIYPCSSISVDWIRGGANIKLAYTVELPDKGAYGFLAPESEVAPVAREIWAGIRQILVDIGQDKNLLVAVQE